MHRTLRTFGPLLFLAALVLSACGPAAVLTAPRPTAPMPEETAAPSPLPTPTTGESLGPSPLPTPTSPESTSGYEPARALDAALATLRERYLDQAPAPDLAWTEENSTPEGLVGAATLRYSAGDWTATVSYPIVAPESLVYDVVVDGAATGFHWEGQVDAQGAVQEGTGAGLEPAPSPAAGEGDGADLTRGSSRFAFALYQLLRQEKGNLFFSPHSLSAALAMTYAGARGDTERQMAQALSFSLPQERLHSAFQALDIALAGRGKGAAGKDGQGFRLHVVNALWGQEGYAFLPEFLDLLKKTYGAGLRQVDFVNAAEEARQTINRWVSDQTEGRIEELIPAGVLDAMTRLVLTNAIYFNAAWAAPFEPSLTQDGQFHRLDGSEVTVPLMHQNESLGYAEGDGYQAVELPYDGGELSMMILLPRAGEFEAVEGALDADEMSAILKRLESQSVELTLPKFEFDSEFSLKDALSSMGMPSAFTPEADFSGMTGGTDLYIGEVLHQAFVSVDEAGTEAAAATAVVMKLTSAPASPVQVTVDRPFLFLIRDVPTGAILFLGRVVDPS